MNHMEEQTGVLILLMLGARRSHRLSLRLKIPGGTWSCLLPWQLFFSFVILCLVEIMATKGGDNPRRDKPRGRHWFLFKIHISMKLTSRSLSCSYSCVRHCLFSSLSCHDDGKWSHAVVAWKVREGCVPRKWKPRSYGCLPTLISMSSLGFPRCNIFFVYFF